MNENLIKLTNQLKERGIKFRLIELKDRAITVEDVVKFSKEDIKPEQICKTLIVKTNKGYVGVFLKGDKKINLDRLRGVLNSKVNLANLEEVKEASGVERGAVCPLLLDIPLVMDEEVLDLERVNFGSGDCLYGIEMKPEDILKLKEVKVFKISD
ncbi:MAG: YbaK/EbsC family protein [Candidatus Aenigmatarchaeota archaeon]